MKKYLPLFILLVVLGFAFAMPALAAPCPDDPTRLCNPVGIDNLEDLAQRIGEAILKLAIPIAVIIIIWIGIQFLLANGNPEKINKAKSALWWTLIGLAVILIGGGFIALIRDILSLSANP